MGQRPPPHALTIAPALAQDLPALAGMTFPVHRPLLAGGVQTAFALAARDDDGAPVGLVLARWPAAEEAGQELELSSVFVNPARRGQGLGLRLLQAAQNEARARGFARLLTSWTTRLPARQAFEQLLAAAGWPAPEPTLLMAMGRWPQIFDAPLLQRPREVPAGMAVFPWAELAPAERQALQQELASGLIPVALSPFADEPDIEPGISVCVRHAGQVVAWMTVIRSPFVPDALCYRSLYVRPQMNARALGALVLTEAIARHNASAIRAQRPTGVFSMSVHNLAMLNFFRKRLAPYCFSSYEGRRSTLALH